MLSSGGASDDLEEAMPQVPWGVGKIVQVMILWLLAYILIGQVCMFLGKEAYRVKIFL